VVGFLASDGALGGGGLAVDLGLISLVGCAAALLRLIQAIAALAFASLGGAFACVGAALALVGLALALVGDALTLIGDALAAARRPLALVGSLLAFGELALSPLEVVLARVVVGRASVCRPEHAPQCPRLCSHARVRSARSFSLDRARLGNGARTAILERMSRAQSDQVRRGAERARRDAQAALELARRRAAMIAARLVELRTRGGLARLDDDERERRAREAAAAAGSARERDLRGHERAARAHDRAARQHEAAAAVYDGRGDAAGAARERAAGARQRRAAEEDRQAARRNEPPSTSASAELE
jgi:hypothetical protein